MFSTFIVRAMLTATITTALFGAATQAPAESATANGPFTATTVIKPQGVGDCPLTWACLWTGTNWSGAMYGNSARVSQLPVGIDNNSLSSANHSLSSVACFWILAGGTGEVLREGPGSIRQNLSLDHRGGSQLTWARVISSLTWNC